MRQKKKRHFKKGKKSESEFGDDVEEDDSVEQVDEGEGVETKATLSLPLFCYEEEEEGFSRWQIWLAVIGCVVSGILNSLFISTLFENALHFSHLSSLERELCFKTEMGFYYTFYKKLTANGDNYWTVLESLKNDTDTEYPNEINDFKRFNIAPEVTLAWAYWRFADFADTMKWKSKECYAVDVPGDQSSSEGKRIVSCVGLGEPVYFYVNAVWILAGITGASVFALGTILSSSLFGGILAVFCFFVNHGHATRVEWTPSLRESFGYPAFLVHLVFLTLLIKSRDGRWFTQIPLLVCLTASGFVFLLTWQLAQFALIVDVWILFILHCFGTLRPGAVYPFLVSQGVAIGLTYLTIHRNELVLCGILTCALLAMVSLGATLGPTLRRHLPPLSAGIAQIGFAAMNMIGFKIELANHLGISKTADDAHVFNLIRAKVGSYKDFDTLLYLGQPEFRPIPGETWWDLTKTALIPCALAVVARYAVFGWGYVKYLIVQARFAAAKAELAANASQGSKAANSKAAPSTDKKNESVVEADDPPVVDPVLALHICLAGAFAVVAGSVMRLKLFLTPQLCVLASLVAAKNFLPKSLRPMRSTLVAVLIACMCFQGWRNVKTQLEISGEGWSTKGEEELINWISKETPPRASFAGDMVTMAAVRLAASRPTVNHPHFEDAAARRRTESIYQAFSRRSAKMLHQALKNASADYLILDSRMCLETPGVRGSLLGIWDSLEPELIGRRPPLCPILYDGRLTAPFKRVFLNDQYSVLKVVSPEEEIVEPGDDNLR